MVKPKNSVIDVIIPAINEEKSIGLVLRDIPKKWVRQIIVCDNGSIDRTAEVAQREGAIVVNAPKRGYGSACLEGLRYLSNYVPPPDILVFMDADYSDHPEELPDLVTPILDGTADLVIGSRALGNLEKGAMTPPQIFGNWLATNLIRILYGYRFTDLGPFRAISYQRLNDLKMEDPNFGWTVEMQVKAAKHGWRCTEVPVTYRKRVGISKVSGTVKGTIQAGYKILWTIFKLIWKR